LFSEVERTAQRVLSVPLTPPEVQSLRWMRAAQNTSMYDWYVRAD